MLLADQLDALPDDIVELYERYNQSVINDIARRLAKMKFDSGAWQMQRLIESGKVYENALTELALLTGKSEAELKRLFQKAGVKAMKFDDTIYRAAGLNPLPLNLSPAMAQVLAAGLAKTNGVMRNLTMTTALRGQDVFIQAADLAYMQVSAGAMSYQQAIKAAIKQTAADGLSVINYGGKHDHLDVAMRRTVLTGINQTVGQLQMTRADEMGQDLVAVSAHIGARNTGVGPANHESWQGKVYSRSGSSKKYPNFVEITGYGTGVGLGGYNCRHSFYPFFEGISENAYNDADRQSFARKQVTYQGEQISVYDATQKQRAIERRIRHWKRQASALEAAGLDNTTELSKVSEWQVRMRSFVKQTGLQRQRERERIFSVSDLRPKQRKIDFHSREFQHVADLGDIGHLFPNVDPGSKYVVPQPVMYNGFGASHLTDKDHRYRLAWLEANRAGLIKAIENPDFVETVLRVRSDGHYSVTLIAELRSGSKTEDRFMVVAVSLGLNPENGYHQITTIHPTKWKDIYSANGMLKPKYLQAK